METSFKMESEIPEGRALTNEPLITSYKTSRNKEDKNYLEMADIFHKEFHLLLLRKKKEDPCLA